MRRRADRFRKFWRNPFVRRQRQNYGQWLGGDVPASTAAIIYSINGGSEIHGVQSNWLRQTKRGNNDGTLVFNNWTTHTWQLSTVSMTNFETLRAQQGLTLTSLESNDQSARNSSRIYARAILESVVNGNQLGINMHNVSLTFRVDTTS